jgi:molybdate transport system substrate-binding protein
VALLVVAACSGEEDDAVIVFAAASLTDAFTEIADRYDGEVTLSFAGSSALREQIDSGAPADVFASADARDAGEAFATNSLVIAVAPGNEAGVGGLADFARDELLLGLCAPEVPCGALARDALDLAGVEPSLDTEEPDVRALLAKVASGELDAGIVYRTDVEAAEVDTVRVPKEHDVVASYPIAALTDAGESFVELVLSDEGRSILASHGFGPPA